MNLLNEIETKASPEYLAFIDQNTDGAYLGDYISLYAKADLDERNKTYELAKYLPGWFTLGDDGGGVAILMRLDGSTQVYQCGHGALGSLDPEPVAPSFARWLSDECPAAWMDDDDDEEERD